MPTEAEQLKQQLDDLQTKFEQHQHTGVDSKKLGAEIAYGGYYTTTDYPFTIASANTYYGMLSGTLSLPCEGTSHADGVLTISTPGRYLVNWMVSFKGNEAAAWEIFKVAPFKNGDAQEQGSCRAAVSDAFEMTLSGTTIINFSRGDELTLRVQNLSDAHDIYVFKILCTATLVS